MKKNLIYKIDFVNVVKRNSVNFKKMCVSSTAFVMAVLILISVYLTPQISYADSTLDVDSTIEGIIASGICSADDVKYMSDLKKLNRESVLITDETMRRNWVTDAIASINPTSVTDYEKVLIAVTSLDVDGSHLDSYKTFVDRDGNTVTNIVSAIGQFDVSNLNTTSAVYALFAFDSGSYEAPAGTWSRENLVAYLLASQVPGGGWNYGSGVADTDVSAMVITALAPYQAIPGVSTAINDALTYLQTLQNSDGTMSSAPSVWGGVVYPGVSNADSTAWVITALSTLGFDAATDTRFIKTTAPLGVPENHSLLDSISNFKTMSGAMGYDNNTTDNEYASEEVLLALAACKTKTIGSVNPLFSFGNPSAPVSWNPSSVSGGSGISSRPGTVVNGNGGGGNSTATSNAAISTDGAITTGGAVTSSGAVTTGGAVITGGAVNTSGGAISPENSENSYISGKFTDVDTNAWYYEAICYSAEKGYLNGISDNEFAPETSMSRSMMITVLYRMNNLHDGGLKAEALPENPVESSIDTIFTYVNSNSWYSEALSWAHKNNLAKGYPDGTFGVDKSISRQEAVTFFMRYFEMKTSGEALQNESSETDWTTSMDWAYEKGLIQGSEGDLMPEKLCSRAEMSQMIFNYLTKFES